MTKTVDRLTAYQVHDEAFESMKWVEKIPPLQFKPDWQVKIIPPFMGAVIRFWVRTERMEKTQWVSVYLDGYNMLGGYKSVYWEIWPDFEGDNARFGFEDTEGLLSGIEKSIKMLETRKN